MLPYSPTMCGALEQCSRSTQSPSSYSYYSSPVVSVICQGNTTSQSECSSGDLRLVGGERESEGRVEICAEGLWGTVCDSGWDQREAVVVCRQSGFGTRRNSFDDPGARTFSLNCRSHVSDWCLF